nr:hypothetical protein Iba_chr01cCG16090 [Ipomoea batatas]
MHSVWVLGLATEAVFSRPQMDKWQLLHKHQQWHRAAKSLTVLTQVAQKHSFPDRVASNSGFFSFLQGVPFVSENRAKGKLPVSWTVSVHLQNPFLTPICGPVHSFLQNTDIVTIFKNQK